MKKIITRDDCSRFDICGAALCPYDPELKHRLWYPEEAICVKQNMIEKYHWVKIQKRIKKKVINQDRYFVVEMLEALTAVGKGTLGLNSDSELTHEHQLKNWVKHRSKAKKREYTDEQKEMIRERFVKGRKIAEEKRQLQLNF